MSMNFLILFAMNNYFSSIRSLLYVSIKQAMKLTVVIIKEYHWYDLNMKCYLAFFSQVNSISSFLPVSV
jgi:hypothetical protein